MLLCISIEIWKKANRDPVGTTQAKARERERNTTEPGQTARGILTDCPSLSALLCSTLCLISVHPWLGRCSTACLTVCQTVVVSQAPLSVGLLKHKDNLSCPHWSWNSRAVAYTEQSSVAKTDSGGCKQMTLKFTFLCQEARSGG